MFVWAEIPDPYKDMGSLDFSIHLLKQAKVAVSPGMGFGPTGEKPRPASPSSKTNTASTRP